MSVAWKITVVVDGEWQEVEGMADAIWSYVQEYAEELGVKDLELGGIEDFDTEGWD